LVIAQRFSSETNRRLKDMTTEQARKLISEATVNGELYRSLLLNEGSTARQVREGEAALNGWFAAQGISTAAEPPQDTMEALQGMFRQPEGTLTPGFEPPMQ
jgi:2-methylcitrate dehydratase PrpD